MQHHQLKHKEVKRKFSKMQETADGMPIILITDHIQDPRNLGALFRLADAAGIRQVFLIGDIDMHKQDKMYKVARSTNRHIQIQILKSVTDIVSLKEQYELIALEITANSVNYSSYQPRKPVALIVGNEKNGISPEILELVDCAIHIPMYGTGSSMNVAMAAAIAVYGLLPHIPLNTQPPV